MLCPNHPPLIIQLIIIILFMSSHNSFNPAFNQSTQKSSSPSFKPSFVSKNRKKIWPSLSLWFIDHIHIPLQAILLNTNTIENNSHNFCLSTFASPPIHLLCLDGEKKLKKEQAIIQKRSFLLYLFILRVSIC